MIIKQYRCPKCNGEYFFNAEEKYSEICQNCGNELKLWKINDNGKISVVDESNILGAVNPNNFDQHKQKKDGIRSSIYKVFELIGGIMCVIGIFLPYVTATFFGMAFRKSFFEMAGGDQFLSLGIAVVGIIAALRKQHFQTAMTGIIYGVFFYPRSVEYFSNVFKSEYGAMVSKGSGFYLMVIGI